MKTIVDELTNPDICANKHGGNEQSEAANERVDKQKDRAFVLNFIKENGTGYSKQIARAMNKPLNCISGRLTELKADGEIVSTGTKWEGCEVYELKDKWRLI